MGADDYSSAIGGGLKLKGSKPAGVVKKKKKKKEGPDKDKGKASDKLDEDVAQSANRDAEGEEGGPDLQQEDKEEDPYASKTEAERKHEETRRKRLEDRLQKQGGGKTHKQRVEELNRYLSNLSEHHDMPRIGPG